MSFSAMTNVVTPAPKAAPKGKHVQLFKMRHKVGKGFYSTAPDAPDGQ